MRQRCNILVGTIKRKASPHQGKFISNFRSHLRALTGLFSSDFFHVCLVMQVELQNKNAAASMAHVNAIKMSHSRLGRKRIHKQKWRNSNDCARQWWQTLSVVLGMVILLVLSNWRILMSLPIGKWFKNNILMGQRIQLIWIFIIDATLVIPASLVMYLSHHKAASLS